MDKIRIMLTASAILLTFGPGGSAAQSVTEIAAGAKLCKAISDDERRLKCFDDLFAEKPSAPSAVEKSGLEAGWSIKEGKSPTDNSPQHRSEGHGRHRTDIAVAHGQTGCEHDAAGLLLQSSIAWPRVHGSSMRPTRELKATSVQEMRRQDVQSRMWV